MHNNHINLNNAQDKAREHKQASKNPGYEKDAPVAAIYAYKHTDMKDFINSIVKFESPDTPVIKVDVKDEKVARSNFAEFNSLTIKTKTLKWLRCVLHAIVFEAELIKKPDLTESKFNFNRIRQIKSGRLILMFQRILYPEESELKIMINSGQINKLSQLFTYGEHRGWKEIYKEFEKDLIAIKKRIK
ncbi:chorismate synthase [Acrasis kona]|uniref:Chorismate synthase n=1 Tax=Acrasis kona TaxID=1008807 RepID=A0AAW2YN06_9EUKA